MNSPTLLLMASAVASSLHSGCSEETNTSYQGPSDPVAQGLQFTSVCKVGERGGDGTLIAPIWVLTAGHVAEGMYRRSSGDLKVYFDDGTEHAVKDVFLHPGFEPMGPYDLALLHLEAPVLGIEPSPLYTKKDELGQLIHLVGHGDKRNADGTWIKDGRIRAYTNVVDEVTDTHIIFDYDAPDGDATEHEGTSGPGDSGGPAFIHTPLGFAVAGVSSMGEPGNEGPCSYGAIEHFVRVSQFLGWINAVMGDPSAHDAHSMRDPRGTLMGEGRNDLNGAEKNDLGDLPQERAAKLIFEALFSNDDGRLAEAIEATYDPAILAKRDAHQIMRNMPALVQQLRGAQLFRVMTVTDAKVALIMEKDSVHYGLDLFFRANGTIEQMAFGKLDR